MEIKSITIGDLEIFPVDMAMGNYKNFCPECGDMIETVNDPDGHKIYHDLCFKKAGLLVGGKK